MTGPVFKAFEPSTGQSLNVLTLAARYPSRVQPWMMNHLIQLEKNGGRTRIVSINTDDYEFPQALSHYEFSQYYWRIGESHSLLLSNALKQLVRPRTLLRTLKLLRNTEWPDSAKQKLVQALSAYAMTLTPDLIHCHSEPVGSRLYHLIKANGAPLIHTFHGQAPVGVPTISRESRSRYTRCARAILVNTRFAQQRYQALGAENDNFIVVPQGTDIEQWAFTPSPCPNADTPLQLLTVGRLVEEKGHRYVIDALKQLRDHAIPVHYHIVGSGPEDKALRQQVQATNLQDSVTFHGFLSGEALAEQYRQAQVFILPSLKGDGHSSEETQGVVVQEAQASGLLVIAADSGGIAECIRDGENAFLVPDRNGTAIADKISMLLKAPEQWSNWQRNAREWVAQHYSLESTGKRVYDIYQQVVSGKL